MREEVTKRESWRPVDGESIWADGLGPFLESFTHPKCPGMGLDTPLNARHHAHAGGVLEGQIASEENPDRQTIQHICDHYTAAKRFLLAHILFNDPSNQLGQLCEETSTLFVACARYQNAEYIDPAAFPVMRLESLGGRSISSPDALKNLMESLQGCLGIDLLNVTSEVPEHGRMLDEVTWKARQYEAALVQFDTPEQIGGEDLASRLDAHIQATLDLIERLETEAGYTFNRDKWLEERSKNDWAVNSTAPSQEQPET